MWCPSVPSLATILDVVDGSPGAVRGAETWNSIWSGAATSSTQDPADAAFFGVLDVNWRGADLTDALVKVIIACRGDATTAPGACSVSFQYGRRGRCH